MVAASTPSQTRSFSRDKRGSVSGTVERLFSPELFQLKLLVGTAVGVLVIVVFAVACVVLTIRNQQRDRLRAHTIEVMRLSSIVEQEVSALENACRGHLLTREGAYLESS